MLQQNILPLWEAASSNSLANFTSSLEYNSSAQGTLLDRLLTTLLSCKGHLFHHLKPAHTVLVVIIHLQIAIRYSVVVTSKAWHIPKESFSLSTSYLVNLTPLDKPTMPVGHQFRFGKQRSQDAGLLAPSNSPCPHLRSYHFLFQFKPYLFYETSLFQTKE